MTRDEFRQIANILNAAYSEKGYTFINGKEQAEGWYETLADLDFRICKKAVLNIITTSEKAPKVATIRNAYFELTSASSGMSEGEAWAMVRDGIRNGTYGATEEFNKFPPEIQRAVGDPVALSEWAMMSSDEVETIIHSQFLRSYREEKEIEKKNQAIGLIGAKRGSMAELAEKVAKMLEVDDADSN